MKMKQPEHVLNWNAKTEEENNKDSELTPFDVLEILNTAYWGKQMYFLQDDGKVYDRLIGDYVSLEIAINRFAERLILD